MIPHRLGVGILLAMLAILGQSGLSTDAPAQPAHIGAAEGVVAARTDARVLPATEQFVESEVLLKYKEKYFRPDKPKERARRTRELQRRLPSQYRNRPAKTFPRLGIQRLSLPPGQSVSQAIMRLKQDPLVDFVEPNHKIFPLYTGPPNDQQWLEGYLWGMKSIGMKQAWDTPSSALADNVIVAVLDSGIAYLHPDLSPQMWRNLGEHSGTTGEDDDGNLITDDIYGAGFCGDFKSGEGFTFGDISDGLSSHGTIVAGIIGAVYNNPSAGGTSEHGYVAGVHSKAKLMGLKILCGGDARGTVGDAIAAIEYAYEHNAHIINASWAIASAPSGNDSLKLAIAKTRNMLFVAAAGNNVETAPESERNNNAIPVYPANYGTEGLDNVIAVAATAACDGPLPKNDICPNGTPAGIPMSEHLSRGSHFGSTTVHLAAPGKDIVSTGWEHGATPPAITLLGEGTSVAAAHVSGCAALLQARQLVATPSSPLTPSELKTLIMDNGDPLSSLASTTISGKRLNCAKALSKLPISPSPSPPIGLIIH